MFPARVRNTRWTEEQLLEMRKEVLSWWPTGKDIDLDEAVEYRRNLPDSKKWVSVTLRAKSEGRILAGIHTGHATVEDTLEHFRAVQEAGCDLANLAPDTYSRRARYAEAGRALEESIRQGKSLLNGFPIVNHGLAKARYIRENIGMPILLIDPDSEHCALLTEMGLAAGFERCSSDIESLLRASKGYSPEQKIAETQYQNRLAGYYTERGAPVQVIVICHLSGLDPPGMKVALGVLHALLAAEQGVKHIALSLSLTAHLVQDVAALRLAREMTREHLHRSGYEADVSVTCFQFLGPWPRDREAAAAVSALNSMIPVLAGVDWFPVKSTAEAVSIPDKEANIAALKIARHLIGCLGRQRLDAGDELRLEQRMMRLEAEAIIEKALELGDGDPAVGQVRALESGVIDASFSPYRGVKGAVFYLRDDTGAVRYLKHGSVPLPGEVAEYHREKIARRERVQTGKTRTQMIVDDIGVLSGL